MRQVAFEKELSNQPHIMSPIGYVILGIFAIISTISVYLLTTVIKYLDRKPFGMQTTIDLLLKDVIYVIMASKVVFFIIATLMNGSIQMDFIVACGIVFVCRLFIAFWIATMQSFLVVKSLVIFYGTMLENFSDNQVQVYSRKCSLAYALAMVFGDFGFTGPNTLLDHITGTANGPYVLCIFAIQTFH